MRKPRIIHHHPADKPEAIQQRDEAARQYVLAGRRQRDRLHRNIFLVLCLLFLAALAVFILSLKHAL